MSLVERLLFNVAARKRAARVEPPPDAIVGYDLDGLFLRRSPETRFAVAVKGGIADEARFERGVPRARLLFEARLERRNVRRASVVVVPSTYSKGRIEEDYGIFGADAAKIRVVPEPIDLARWETAFASARPDSEGEGRAPSILSVAHLYPRKDVALLVEAVARRWDGAVLRVVGDGPELSRLRRLVARLSAQDRVALLGHVPFARLAAEYRRADVFCLPSRQEGFGIVFLEAMAAGLPIVAARAAAVPEVVADGECGLLVPPGDAEALSTALDRLIADAALRAQMGAAGRRKVQDYDAPKVALRFLEALGIPS